MLKYILLFLLWVTPFTVHAQPRIPLDIYIVSGYGGFNIKEKNKEVLTLVRYYTRKLKLRLRYRVKYFKGDFTPCMQYLDPNPDIRKKLIYCVADLTSQDKTFRGIKRVYLLPPAIKTDETGREYSFYWGSALLGGKVAYATIGESKLFDVSCLVSTIIAHEVCHLFGCTHTDERPNLMHPMAGNFVNLTVCNFLQVERKTRQQVIRWLNKIK